MMMIDIEAVRGRALLAGQKLEAGDALDEGELRQLIADVEELAEAVERHQGEAFTGMLREAIRRKQERP